MNCTRCLLRLQGVGFLASTARAVSQHAATIKPSTQSLTQAPTQSLPPHNTCGQVLRRLHCSPICAKGQAEEERALKTSVKSLVIQDNLFERSEVKTKATFNRAIDVFIKRDIRRRGHVEFIYAALQKMPEFGVECDLAVYNKLLDVFPKEVFVPKNFIQRMFNHYPRQQECGVEVLEQMSQYGVMPNVETKVLLIQIFGDKSHPIRKYQRIMYWFPRFQHTNPFPVPLYLPEDPVDLARLSLNRIANDLSAKVTVYQMPSTDISETGEEITLPHVVGVQSPDQMELLAKHDPSRPVFVEGPFPLWLISKHRTNTCVYYYILRADPLPPVEEPYDPERCFDYPLQLDLDLELDLSVDLTFDVDEVDEGPVFAMCMSGRGDQATLNQWISGLQETNPILGHVPTLFRLGSDHRELQGGLDSDPGRSSYEADLETDTQAWQERQPDSDIVVEEELGRSRGVKQ